MRFSKGKGWWRMDGARFDLLRRTRLRLMVVVVGLRLPGQKSLK
jgi:hypothetical protein